MGRALPIFDRSVGVLLVKVGRYPLHHGTVGAIRSLGRLGVPVYAIVEERFTPAARSRYLTRRFCRRLSPGDDPEEMVDGVLRIGEAIGGRPILLATDDEAAVLIAEHADRLRARFVLPATPPDLPRKLASKQALHALCERHGIPTPASARPRTPEETLEVAEELGFPVVLKNDEPWLRITRPAVASTAIVPDRNELADLVASWTAMPSVMVQEHIPRDGARDWIAHAYVGEGPRHSTVFTGRKLRSWPPQAGVTTYAYTHTNAEVAGLTSELCTKVGFRGICDLDWRFDARSGEYKLVDFNPRLGAQFRLFERRDGVDVVRAMHLDLTGKEIPPAAQIDGRRYVVENLDVPAAIAYGWSGWREAAPSPCAHRELAWLAADDPVPAVLGCLRSLAYGGTRILTRRLGSYRL